MVAGHRATGRCARRCHAQPAQSRPCRCRDPGPQCQRCHLKSGEWRERQVAISSVAWMDATTRSTSRSISFAPSITRRSGSTATPLAARTSLSQSRVPRPAATAWVAAIPSFATCITCDSHAQDDSTRLVEPPVLRPVARTCQLPKGCAKRTTTDNADQLAAARGHAARPDAVWPSKQGDYAGATTPNCKGKVRSKLLRSVARLWWPQRRPENHAGAAVPISQGCREGDATAPTIASLDARSRAVIERSSGVASAQRT